MGIVCEPSALHLSHPTNAEHFFGFWLQVFHQAGSPQRDLAQMKKRTVSFP